MRQSPRCGIIVADKLPKRWHFLANHRGKEYVWRELMAIIDTVAEHADALCTGNGLSEDAAVDKAAEDLFSEEQCESWKITPTHKKAIVTWLKAP